MAKGITGRQEPDMSVTARRPGMKPTRGEGSGDLLKSVPDSILRTLGGTHLEREVVKEGFPPRTEREFISHDMVHHELKWRNLI
jgi:hypothetical protein